MKNLLALLLASLLIAPAFAQKSTAPDVVKAEFSKNYPNAQKVKWGKEEGNFEVGFRLGSDEMSALYDRNGKQLETERAIAANQLPAAVQAYMKKEGKTIREAAEITNASGARFYEAEARGKDFYFNAEGQPVGKIN